MATQLASAALATGQVEDYRRQGYLILREVFGPQEVAALTGESQTLHARRDLVDSANLRCRWADHGPGGQCLFDCFDPVIDIGPVCRYVSNDERILNPLRAILDDEPCLLKDKLIFKQPGATGYALHQDYIGWQDFPESFTTVIVAIDESDATNGAT
ncbi:MAG TPA: phytanoyl-CoA dioxygenase family protein, partial [Pirellulales bacterium]|nr:phytanoyl-CoA dioxygenase family protein [Pirellulales bacterium]